VEASLVARVSILIVAQVTLQWLQEELLLKDVESHVDTEAIT
jgi:hypothetical protein